MRFKVVCWGHDFQPYRAMVWDYLIVGLLLGLFYCWVIIEIVLLLGYFGTHQWFGIV
jgi:hypothetical protein